MPDKDWKSKLSSPCRKSVLEFGHEMSEESVLKIVNSCKGTDDPVHLAEGISRETHSRVLDSIILSLATIKDERTIIPLGRYFGKGVGPINWDIVTALKEIGMAEKTSREGRKAAILALRRATSHDILGMKKFVIEALRSVTESDIEMVSRNDAVKSISLMLDDEDADVRIQAAKALRNLAHTGPAVISDIEARLITISNKKHGIRQEETLLTFTIIDTCKKIEPEMKDSCSRAASTLQAIGNNTAADVVRRLVKRMREKYEKVTKEAEGYKVKVD